MINNLAVLFSCLMVAFVIFRAVLLDRQLPWFGGEKADSPTEEARRWRTGP